MLKFELYVQLSLNCECVTLVVVMIVFIVCQNWCVYCSMIKQGKLLCVYR